MVIGNSPLEQPLRYSVRRVGGLAYERTWIGHKTAIDFVATAEKPFAESIEVSGRANTYTCTARYAYDPAGTEIPTESQEIDTEAIQQSIFLNKTFQKLPQKIQQKVRHVFDTPEPDGNGLTTYEKGVNKLFDYTRGGNGITGTDPSNALGHFALAVAAYDLLLMGTETFEMFSFVISRTRTCSRNYATGPSLSTISKIYTTAEMVSTTGNQLLWTIPTLTVSSEEASKNLFAGWRKRSARVQDVANGHRQIVEQWHLAKWSLDLYEKLTP